MGRTSDARERIVRTAARLFLTRSYQAVGIDELCGAADVHKGSFYYYFPSKAHLARVVVDHHAAALWARLDSAGAETPLRQLRAVADAVGAIHTDFESRFGRVVGCAFGNLAAEVATTDNGLREHVAAVLAEWERRIAIICHRVAEEGLFRPGVDPERFAHALMAQFQGLILLAKVSRSPAADISRALHEVIAANLREGVLV
jgi:TetR/AcrR family transcriptional repressor of nem operon